MPKYRRFGVHYPSAVTDTQNGRVADSMHHQVIVIMGNYILAIDQGTTSSRAIIFDALGNIQHTAQYTFKQHYPADGWVEHDPTDIWETTLTACTDVLAQTQHRIETLGITNQRETTLVWDRNTGLPVYHAIVWQDRRTADYCESLRQAGHQDDIASRTGLILDAYFSASKVNWILANVAGARAKAEAGELVFGTVDTFLIWKLTKGAVHATDASNASRTMLFNIHTQSWDEELLALFEVPPSMLPEVKNSADHYGQTATDTIGSQINIGGVIGDQQGALIGQACFDAGMVKSTYGTGCFMVMNTGDKPVSSSAKLLTTVAYRLDNKVSYAIEGSIFNAGTAIQWLRDDMQLFEHVDELDHMLAQTQDNQGVYMVPAFTGLGAPHWDPHARGAILGLTRNTSRAILVRAALEAVCYQTRELMDAMSLDSDQAPSQMRVDGGMAANNWLLQFLSDIINVDVLKPTVIETSALGAAYLAGLSQGIYSSTEQIAQLWRSSMRFQPSMNIQQRTQFNQDWDRAVGRVKSIDASSLNGL